MKLLAGLFGKPPDLRGLPLGQAGEEWIAYLYRRRGYRILARNYALYGPKKLGEIDIICGKKRQITIVEVRTRRSESQMSIAETVDGRKQSYLRRMTKLYLQANPKYENYDIQIDVAAVLMNPFDNSVLSVNLIENAIEDSV